MNFEDVRHLIQKELDLEVSPEKFLIAEVKEQEWITFCNKFQADPAIAFVWEDEILTIEQNNKTDSIEPAIVFIEDLVLNSPDFFLSKYIRSNVTWEQYEKLNDQACESKTKFSFCDGVLEIK